MKLFVGAMLRMLLVADSESDGGKFHMFAKSGARNSVCFCLLRRLRHFRACEFLFHISLEFAPHINTYDKPPNTDIHRQHS